MITIGDMKEVVVEDDIQIKLAAIIEIRTMWRRLVMLEGYDMQCSDVNRRVLQSEPRNT